MKFEVGKSYRTREDHKVRCICTDRHDSAFPVVCLLEEPASKVDVLTYTSAGHYLISKDESSYDIVTEWAEEQTVYININQGPEGRPDIYAYPSKDIAISATDARQCIARKKLTFTPGQFDE